MQTDRNTCILDTVVLSVFLRMSLDGQSFLSYVLNVTNLAIPSAVQSEVGRAGQELAQSARQLILAKQLEVHQPPSRPLVTNFYNVGDGEADCIRLALSSGWTPVTNDIRAAKVGLNYGVYFLLYETFLLRLIEAYGLEAQIAITMLDRLHTAKQISPSSYAHLRAVINEEEV